jgi:hydrogenase nickel incorporation protein HypB
MDIITVERKVLKKNDQLAEENRERFWKSGTFVLNLLSSPGAGKTTLLEQTVRRLKGTPRVAVIEGDVQTDNDARRVAATGVPAVQIVTNGGCHLDANLVQDALASLDLSTVDLLFIENVGNLVCPAGFDLGEDAKVVIASTTEGDDKPQKYPNVFRVARVCVINKTDLLPHLDFDVEAFKAHATAVNPDLRFFETSARTGEGLDEWCAWLVDTALEPREPQEE